MIYKLLKIWAQLAFSLYFRRIFISGRENIPRRGALMILVNHPNSFMEPCVIAAFQHRDLHFLVRGDMFEKKWLLPLLKSTYQIPIYRMKDGFGKLRNNRNTFEQVYKILSKGKTIMMFPEASSEMVKYLRPLQKGAARLALGAMEDDAVDELIIVPSGIHYFNAPESRNDVVLQFGKAVSMKQWLLKNADKEDKIHALTAFLQEKMEEVVISISHTEDEKIYNEAYIIAEAEQLPYHDDAGLINTKTGYNFLKMLVEKLNAFTNTAFNDLGQMIAKYTENNDLRAHDAMLSESAHKKCKRILRLCFYFIAGIIGYAVYFPVLALSKWFTRKKINHVTFYAPVRIALTMFTHLLMTFILFFILKTWFSIWISLLLIFVLQCSLYCFAYFKDEMRYVRYYFKSFPNDIKEKYLKMREEILGRLRKSL